MSNDFIEDKPGATFWVIGGAALIWNLFGLFSYVNMRTSTPEALATAGYTPEQIAFIINHADDRYVMVDLLIFPLLEKIADRLSGVKGIIVMTSAAAMSNVRLSRVRFMVSDRRRCRRSRGGRRGSR